MESTCIFDLSPKNIRYCTKDKTYYLDLLSTKTEKQISMKICEFTLVDFTFDID